MQRKRVGIFGWGLVAPRSPNLAAFARNLERSDSWLTPFREYGQSNFLVGYPEFNFDDYHEWFSKRFPPSRFSQVKEKMGPVAQYAIGSFIQSLQHNEGLEEYLQGLGAKCHVYVGTGLGDISVQHEESLKYERALRRWNEFWAHRDRCSPLRAHLAGDPDPLAPVNPDNFDKGSEAWIDAKHEWEKFWTGRSDALAEYLSEAAVIQGEPVPPSSGTGKLGTIRQKLNRIKALNRKWGCPEEPWASVSANLLWNIASIGASQISMIGKIMGSTFAPVGACASFGVALKLADNAIQLGQATAVVIGMSDPPPLEPVVSAFYNANVLASDPEVSRPMTGLKGTHVAGGACVWIVGDAEVMMAHGFQPLGLEIVSIGTSSDAHHIITPSKAGPQLAIRQALDGLDTRQVATWDLHATATPGDATEIAHSLEMLHRDVIFTARKGVFGHGMSVGGGWELTAQHLGVASGRIFPIPLTEGELHADVALHSPRFADESGCEISGGYSGKLSMGVGGINACVISRKWDPEYLRQHVAERATNTRA